MRRVSWKVITLFLFLPLTLYTFLFTFPAVQALYLSLTDWSGLFLDSNFIGLKNYISLYNDPIFKTAFWNTVAYMVFGGALVFSISLFFTYLMTVLGMKGKKFFTSFFYFPNMISGSAIALLWVFAFDPNFGLINNVLEAIGLDFLAIPWLGSRASALGCFIVISLWSNVGFYFLVLVSGLDRIPTTFLEAAKIDGATDRQSFFVITLPLLKDIILINMTLWVINSVRYFDIPWAMTEGGPANQTHTLATYLYMSAFGRKFTHASEYGYASAIAVVMVIIILLANILIRRNADEEALEY